MYKVMRDFDKWLAAFRPSIADYKYYVDFDKVFANVEAIKIPLNILNSLIGSKNIEKEFEAILKQYPETLKCIPILIAKREMEIYALEDSGKLLKYDFHKSNYSIEQYLVFMRETGLLDLLQHHIINNLVDYVTGVEVGVVQIGDIDDDGVVTVKECGFDHGGMSLWIGIDGRQGDWRS